MESRAKAGSGSDTVGVTHRAPRGRCTLPGPAVPPRASLRTPVGTRLALTHHDLAVLGRQHLWAGSVQWRVAGTHHGGTDPPPSPEEGPGTRATGSREHLGARGDHSSRGSHTTSL